MATLLSDVMRAKGLSVRLDGKPDPAQPQPGHEARTP